MHYVKVKSTTKKIQGSKGYQFVRDSSLSATMQPTPVRRPGAPVFEAMPEEDTDESDEDPKTAPVTGPTPPVKVKDPEEAEESIWDRVNSG
jgi:hypothetical protein